MSLPESKRCNGQTAGSKEETCFASRIGFRASIGHKPVSREASDEPKQLDVSHTSTNVPLQISLPQQLHTAARPHQSLRRRGDRKCGPSVDITIEPLAAQLDKWLLGESRVASLCSLHYTSLPCFRATVLIMIDDSSLALSDNVLPYHGWHFQNAVSLVWLQATHADVTRWVAITIACPRENLASA